MNALGFDPNGMVMDYGRSCWSGQVRFVRDNATIKQAAIWYIAKETAKAFPGQHAFGNPIYDSDKGLQTTIGWVAATTKNYYEGDPLNASDGTSFAGPAEYFLDGQPPSGVTPLVRGVDGTPLDCLGTLGAVGSGHSIPPYSVSPSCVAPVVMPSALQAKLSFTPSSLFPGNNLPAFDLKFSLGAVTPAASPGGVVFTYWQGGVVINGVQCSVYFGCDTTGLSGPLRAEFDDPFFVPQAAGLMGGAVNPVSPWNAGSLFAIGVYFGVVAIGTFDWTITTLGG